MSAASPFLRDTSICPAGKVVFGGGAQVVGEGTADFRTSLQELAPGTIGGGAQSLWLTALRNNDIKQHKVGLFAVCASKPLGYQVVRKDVPVPAGGFLRATAVCPTGKVVLAGGSQVVGEGTADFRTRLQESAPGTINDVTVAHGSGSTTVTFTASDADDVLTAANLSASYKTLAQVAYDLDQQRGLVNPGGNYYFNTRGLAPGRVEAGSRVARSGD